MSERTRMGRATPARRRGHTRRSERRPPAITWESAQWAKAGAVALWIDARIATPRIGACGVTGDLSTWRKGGTVSFWKVDRVFTRLGLHVAQLPDDVWAPTRRG